MQTEQSAFPNQVGKMRYKTHGHWVPEVPNTALTDQMLKPLPSKSETRQGHPLITSLQHFSRGFSQFSNIMKRCQKCKFRKKIIINYGQSDMIVLDSMYKQLE